MPRSSLLTKRRPAHPAANAPSAASDAIKRSANLFVVGDLVIDHTAFVSDVTQKFPVPVTGEHAYEVKHRLDTAGGAATTARTIDALTDGTTFLWGLVGSSPWGTFRAILENSQALDGTKSRIELRGIRDETDASMTTISRLVAIHSTDEGRDRYERKARFVDFSHLHVSMDRQRCAIQYHLARVHNIKAPLDAIVLNDLDMSALRPDVLEAVAAFGEEHHIPVVVRARRDAPKYSDLRASALICTLPEWSQFVSSKQAPNWWSANIEKPEVAEEFARQTLSVFHRMDRFVVLVGDDWIDRIITLEQDALGGPGSLVVDDGLPQADKGKTQQVGASDVFTGALALAVASRDEAPRRFASAVRFARSAAKAYQTMDWHRVPSRGAVEIASAADSGEEGKVITSRQFGTRYLPPTRTIQMSDAATCIPNILSVTQGFRERLISLEQAVKDGEDAIVLVAAGGSGKTEIAKHLLRLASNSGLEARDLQELNVKWSWSSPDTTVDALKTACARRSARRAFVIVDEALKFKGANTLPKQGVVLLNAAKDAGIRLLLIDADFAKIDTDKIRSQFLRRVSWHTLPSPWERPFDIPYVFFAMLRSHVADAGVSISADSSGLVAVIEWLIHERQNFGRLHKLAKDLVAAKRGAERVFVRWSDLPVNVRGAYQPYYVARTEEYAANFD